MKYGILICGAPGTGKSTHIKKMLDQAGFDEEYILADPDKLPGEHSEQSKKAFELLEEAIEHKKNVVYVGSCVGVRTIHGILHEMKTNKFHTIVAIAYTSIPTALKRIASRTEQPLDADIASEVHQFFKTKAEKYMKLHEIDALYLYNNETEFNLLLSKKKKKIVCSDPKGEFYFDISKYC
uniref:AAA+ ATPase domain-containing protein n=1 Tax=viral metagenome TaxID=1070528 RepID=A0A6C0CG63_9ZZZZ